MATTSDLALLAHRIDALETSLIKSGALLPSDLEHYLKSTRENTANFPLPRDQLGAGTVPAERLLPTAFEETMDDTEGAALTLEHLTFGRSRMGPSHHLPHFGARHGPSPGRVASNNSYQLARSGSLAMQGPLGMEISPGGTYDGSTLLGSKYSDVSPEEKARQIDTLLDVIGPTDIFDLFYRKTDVALRALIKVLPRREKGEMLVNAVSQKHLFRRSFVPDDT